jgi:hypothetical protein
MRDHVGLIEYVTAIPGESGTPLARGGARSRRLDRVRDCNSVRERNSAHPPRIGVSEASPGGWYSSRLEIDREPVKTRRPSARRRGNAHTYGARCDRLSQGISQLFHCVDARPSTFRPKSGQLLPFMPLITHIGNGRSQGTADVARRHNGNEKIYKAGAQRSVTLAAQNADRKAPVSEIELALSTLYRRAVLFSVILITAGR